MVKKKEVQKGSCKAYGIKKNRKILEEWYEEAHAIAIKKGLRQMIDKDVFIDSMMSDSFIFRTIESEREDLIVMMSKYLLLAESYCKLIGQGKMSRSFFRLGFDKSIVW